MDLYNELQNLRAELINDINMKFDSILKQIDSTSDNDAKSHHNINAYETIMPFNMHSAAFKGKKPICVIFPNGLRVNAFTWKNVVSTILGDCVKNKKNEDALKELTGKVSGRNRLFLDSNPENMRSPIKITEGLFMETHYDTETLIRILTTRILDPIQYDYSKITIAIRNN